jgi:rhodanese-related sulfurtransferase
MGATHTVRELTGEVTSEVHHISLERTVYYVQGFLFGPKMKNLPQYLRNGLLSLGLFLFSIGVGISVNLMRPESVPLVYEAPASGFQRLESGQAWKPGITVIEIDTAQTLVEHRAALVLDARPDLFFEFGHLPGALNLSKKNFAEDYKKSLPKITEAEAVGVPLLLYCAHEHCKDASEVARELEKKGHRVILIYEGGYDEWERLGLKIEKGA